MGERKPVIVQKKKSDRQNKIEQLQNQLVAEKEKMSVLLVEKTSLPVVETVGMIVRHKSWGEGIVTACDGTHITVDLPVGEKTFQMPMVFEKGFLIPSQEDYLDNVAKHQAVDAKISELQEIIDSLEQQLSKLAI